jgi:hypothetical protein
MLFEVTEQQAIQVEQSALALRDRMCAIGILHEVDGLIEFDEAI